MKHLFSLFLIFFLLSLVHTVTFIHDLQGEDVGPFSKELAKWSPTDIKMTSIAGITPKVFFFFDNTCSYTIAQKTYTGISSHQYIVYSFAVVLSGDYDGDIFHVEFDNRISNPLRANSLSLYRLIYIKGAVAHTGSTLTVRFVNRQGANTPFLVGFRELTMNFYKTNYGFSAAFCHTFTSQTGLTPKCLCGIDKGGLSGSCVACNPGFAFCGDNGGRQVCSKCETPVSFIDWDGEDCGSVCDQYCDKCPGLSGDSCSDCLAGHFIYKDGACVLGCPDPLVEVPAEEGGFMKSCESPCGDDEWLYPNNKCGGECSGAFVEEIMYGIKYCVSTCAVGDKYIFRNETCIENCPLPNKKVMDQLGKTCKSPCDNFEDFYNVKEEICEGICEYPYEKDESGPTKLCLIGLDSGQIEQTKQVSKAVNGMNSGSNGAIAALSFLSSSDSTSICMGAFSKMLQYIKYMDVKYPAKVELMLEMMNSNSSTGGFAVKIMKEVLEKFPERGLPERFEYFEARSSFFVNYWPSLFILLIVLPVTMGFVLLANNASKSNNILGKITGILKWNMILLLFCGDFGDIIFFTAMEFSTVEFDSVESVLSFLVCIVINIFAVWVLVKILLVNLRIRESKLKQYEIEARWGNYKTFYAIYKNQSYFQQIFLFIFIVRVSIFNGVIGYFFRSPLLQAILITLVNLGMLLYLLSKRPMKALINLIQQVVLEGFLLIFNICICILAGLDHNGIEAYSFRDSVDEVMVAINLIIPVVSVIILTAKFVILGIEAYKGWRAAKAAEKENLQKDIRIEVPRQRRVPGDQKVKRIKEKELNQSNISSSNASFMNNSQLGLIFQPNERSPRLRNTRRSQSQISSNVSEAGVFDHSTSASPYLPNSILPQGLNISDVQGSPVVQVFKKHRIKRRNQSIKSPQRKVKEQKDLISL